MHSSRFPARFARQWPLGRVLFMALLCGPTLILHADETVRQVQEELRRRDLYFGDIDGCNTPQVSAALRSYQQRKGFSPTGEPDPTTLRSLNLLPALPLAANDPAALPVPPPAPTAAPWPDITVLRSDEARRAPAPPPSADPDAGPMPTPTPGPPPSSAVARALPAADRVRAFLRDYLQAGQTNDTEAELAFYDERVDYFNEGNVDRRFLRADVDRYDRRWPQRQFTLLDPLTLADAPDGDPDKVVAHFRLAFTNKRPHYTVEGKVDDTFILRRTGPESFRIVAMKEQRVRDK